MSAIPNAVRTMKSTNEMTIRYSVLIWPLFIFCINKRCTVKVLKVLAYISG